MSKKKPVPIVDVLKVLQKLPKYCFATVPGENRVVIIHRGMTGYSEPPTQPPNGATADDLNIGLGISKFHAEAMMNGSMWGWHIPGADVDYLKAEAKKRASTRKAEAKP